MIFLREFYSYEEKSSQKSVNPLLYKGIRSSMGKSQWARFKQTIKDFITVMNDGPYGQTLSFSGKKKDEWNGLYHVFKDSRE